MEKADISNLFRLLFFGICVYYGFKIIKHYLFPILLKRILNKFQAKADQHFGAREPDVKEGDTVIDKKTGSKSNANIGGEYIDFEEIE